MYRYFCLPNGMEESNHHDQIYFQNLTIAPHLDTVTKAEIYFRNQYPGIQIRCTGLGYSEFPHKKRIPYISLCLDDCGYPVAAILCYAKNGN